MRVPLANDDKRRFSPAFEGLGAGLVAGAAVGVVEVLVLVVMDGTWLHVEGLLYAVIVYGGLGLLSGLGLGLLHRLGGAIRGAHRPAWAACTALTFGLGLFAVVRNRIRHDVLHMSGLPWSLETMLLDGAVLLVVGLGAAAVLWLALRRLLRTGRVTRARWSVLAYAVTLLVAALLSAGPALAESLRRPARPAGAPPDLRDQPNIILIVGDALRADHVSCYNGQALPTPAIDSLARDGVRYAQMSAQASWTRPSVATMLTSLYPSSHRAITGRDLLPDAVTTLPELLRERGYHTVGFTTNHNVAPEFNFSQGFDEYEFLPGDYPFLASRTSVRFAAYSLFYALRRPFVSPTAYPHNEYYQDAEVLTAHARAWLEANQDARFFLYLHYMDPHAPYFPHPYDGTCISAEVTPNPPADRAPVLRQVYGGEVTFMDAHLGALLDYLRAAGLYDNALILFTSDHGEEFHEHGGWWHCTTLYEELIAVPLIIKYPGNAHAGLVDREFARGLDLAPTVLDVAGVPVPETMQGVSLRPGATLPRAELVFAEEDYAGNSIRAVRAGQHKLIIANEGNPRGLPAVALFDLAADPGEQRNLAAAEPDTVRQLRAELDRILAFAEAQAVAGQSRELDAVTRERLRQLGY